MSNYSWGASYSIVGPAWSISTEFVAYLLFPILVAFTVSRTWLRAWFMAIFAFCLLVFVATRSFDQLHQSSANGPLDIYGVGTPYLVFRCVAGFIFGLLTFRLALSPWMLRLATSNIAGNLTIAAVLLAMAVPRSDVLIVVLFIPLVLTLATEASFIARILRMPVVHWLGEISYSIYVCHYLVHDVLQKPVERLLDLYNVPHPFSISGILMVPLAIALAAACYRLIELPARNLSRILVRQRSAMANS